MDRMVSPAFNFPSRHMLHVTFLVIDIQSRWVLGKGEAHHDGFLPGQLRRPRAFEPF